MRPANRQRHRITRGSLAHTTSRGRGEAGCDPGVFAPYDGRQALAPRCVEHWHAGVNRAAPCASARAPCYTWRMPASWPGWFRADPAIAPLLGRLISAQAVLVSEANLPRLLAIVQDTGYTVKSD